VNLTDIRQRVRDVVRDTPATAITDAMIDRWANEANLDIAARTLGLQDAVAATTSDNTVPLPADFLEPITLRLGTDDDVEFVDDEVWFTHSDGGTTLNHTIARVWKADIEVYPTPAANTAYSLRYYKAPASLSAGGDVPAVAVEQHIRIVNYARAHAKLVLGEIREHDTYLGLYERGLPEPRGSRAKLNPGPLTVSLEPGPFDLDPDRRHN
jgi:hypothetical protein